MRSPLHWAAQSKSAALARPGVVSKGCHYSESDDQGYTSRLYKSETASTSGNDEAIETIQVFFPPHFNCCDSWELAQVGDVLSESSLQG